MTRVVRNARLGIPAWSSGGGHGHLRRQTEHAPQLLVELLRCFRVFLQKGPGVFPALTDPFAPIAEPRPGFLHHVLRHTHIDQITLARSAFTVEDVKLSFSER